MGPTASFARAVMNSTGDVLLFADQDDRWMPEKIAMVIDAFGRSPRPVMVYHDGQITDDALQPTGLTIFGTRQGGQLAQGQLRDPMDIARNPDIKGCTMALDGPFARQLFGSSVEGFDGYWGHDHWAALFAFGTGEVHVLERSLILHRFHASNTSSGMRFDPLRPATLRRYLKALRHQSSDHFVQRYRIALEQVDRGATPFSKRLRDALCTYLDMAERRHVLHALGVFGRIRAALALHRSGIYRQYFNGWATLLRDILAR